MVVGAWSAHATDQAADEPARNAALLDKLVAAYPDFLASHHGNVLQWKDGTEMTFDDGKGAKDFDTRLNDPDLEDMFYAPYPPGRTGTRQANRVARWPRSSA